MQTATALGLYNKFEDAIVIGVRLWACVGPAWHGEARMSLTRA
jgi:hypothetical protein